MQVFKLFLKLLNKYKGNIILYIGIFSGVIFGIIIPNAVKGNQKSYENKKSSYAVFDYDCSEESRIFSEYLAETNECVEISDDSAETIQDELYARNVDCVIKILPGFGEHLGMEDSAAYMEAYTIPGTTTSELFKENVNSFITVTGAYITAGEGANEALRKAADLTYEKTQVSLASGDEAETDDSLHYFFSYLSWVFVVMFITAIAPVLIIFNKKEVRDRISVSAYRFGRLNIEQMLGVLVSGLICLGIFIILAVIFLNGELFSMRGFYYMINAVCLMLVAMAITFFVSRFAKSSQSISVMANIISLGMAFLCGVFVPMELLSDGVIKIAHFLPVYWYEKAISEIDRGASMDVSQLFMFMGIEILFAAAITMISVVISGTRKKA